MAEKLYRTEKSYFIAAYRGNLAKVRQNFPKGKLFEAYDGKRKRQKSYRYILLQSAVPYREILQCTWGCFLFLFFSSGTDKGAEYIKECLKRIIENEDKKNPYSDRVLAEKLQEMDIDISRRTIAKYRNSMHISEALGRKEY